MSGNSEFNTFMGEVQPKPKLGAIELLEELDRKESEEALSIEYQSIESIRELNETYSTYADQLNSIRRELGLENIDFKPEDYRLIKPEVYDTSPFLTKYGKAGAFHDPITGVIFLRFDLEAHESADGNKAYNHYVVGHETTHKSMAGYGIGKYSKDLNEGMTEVINRQIFHNTIIPRLRLGKQSHENDEYIRRYEPTVDGIKIREEDILYSDEDVDTLVYTRVRETRLIEMIKALSPECYEQLLSACFRGEDEEAREIISKYMGEEWAKKFGDRRSSVLDLYRELEKIS